jgi:endonuclease III
VAHEDTYATHMRMVAHGRRLCRSQRPRCIECPLLALCPAGRRGITSGV